MYTTRKVKPALGQTWSHVPNTRILMQKSVCSSAKPNERIATVIKSARQVSELNTYSYGILNQTDFTFFLLTLLQPTDISTTFFIQSEGLQDFP